MADPHRSFVRPLARLNAAILGLSAAILLAFVIWLATMIVSAKGALWERHLYLLSQYLPGYSVSTGGAFVGAAWGFVLGFLFSAPAAWFYYVGVLKQVAGARREPSADADLGHTVVRLRIADFSVAAGMLCGILIFLASILLIVKHEPGQPLGPRLSLLAQYLPGYSVSLRGSLVGFAYFLALGAIGSACVGWIYNALVSRTRASTPR